MGVKPKLLVISSNYPSPDFIYGDVFVHTRLKKYGGSLDISVVGYRPSLTGEYRYMYEGVPVAMMPTYESFTREIEQSDCTLIAVHMMEHLYMPLLLSIQKPIVVFVHGYEATSWSRRMCNYSRPGDIPYLLSYIRLNRVQLKAFRQFVIAANKRSDIHFVFVSNWLAEAVQKDLGEQIKNKSVIPNPIDTDRFVYKPKAPELWKRILIMRSFKARNYANDLSVDAILELSKRPYFSDLEFAIYGQGYLFKTLTDKIKHFKNVTLHNVFVKNHEIPDVHANYGIFLCPSRVDSQGVSMCEAMSSGLVPVTSRIGGISEYVPQEAGYFVKSANEIVSCIENLYGYPDGFESFSRNARSAIELKCAAAVVIPREVALIMSMASNKSQKKIQSSFYRQCSRCILDTKDDPNIVFDEIGVCNYCNAYQQIENELHGSIESGKKNLTKLVSQIKSEGKNKPYDCIIGLSGGVDSTYLALQVKKLGLRPLAVHFDNGWNSELAVSNIEKIVTKLNIPLHTLVIDWQEFRDLQLSFLRASVVDIEVVTDHAIIATLYKLALKFKIRYILNGSNIVTESILPANWIWNKKDHLHIEGIHRVFGKLPLKTYPLFDSMLKLRVAWSGIESVSILDYMPYNKEKVKSTITDELGWRDYGGKHYESIFTRFYQGYILPVKFGIDKRKAHLSNLICSGQISREEAQRELATSPYNSELLRSDYDFVLKKLELSKAEFEEMMKKPAQEHSFYPTDRSIYDRFKILKLAEPLWRFIKILKFGKM